MTRPFTHEYELLEKLRVEIDRLAEENGEMRAALRKTDSALLDNMKLADCESNEYGEAWARHLANEKLLARVDALLAGADGRKPSGMGSGLRDQEPNRCIVCKKTIPKWVEDGICSGCSPQPASEGDPEPDDCAHCSGTGWMDRSSRPRPCRACFATGKDPNHKPSAASAVKPSPILGGVADDPLAGLTRYGVGRTTMPVSEEGDGARACRECREVDCECADERAGVESCPRSATYWSSESRARMCSNCDQPVEVCNPDSQPASANKHRCDECSLIHDKHGNVARWTQEDIDAINKKSEELREFFSAAPTKPAAERPPSEIECAVSNLEYGGYKNSARYVRQLFERAEAAERKAKDFEDRYETSHRNRMHAEKALAEAERARDAAKQERDDYKEALRHANETITQRQEVVEQLRAQLAAKGEASGMKAAIFKAHALLLNAHAVSASAEGVKP